MKEITKLRLRKCAKVVFIWGPLWLLCLFQPHPTNGGIGLFVTVSPIVVLIYLGRLLALPGFGKLRIRKDDLTDVLVEVFSTHDHTLDFDSLLQLVDDRIDSLPAMGATAYGGLNDDERLRLRVYRRLRNLVLWELVEKTESGYKGVTSIKELYAGSSGSGS